MKIVDYHEIDGMTALLLDRRLPLTNWRWLVINGARYEPRH